MGKQTGAALFAPRYCSNQHESPPQGGNISSILQRARRCS
jgi:hypothetical protein